MHNFKELKVYQKSVELAVEIYKITGNLPPDEKYGLVNQLRRSAVSIASNIAEGSGRKSPKDFNHFLSTALGSSFECEAQIEISCKLQLIADTEFKSISIRINEVQKMIYGLQKSIII